MEIQIAKFCECDICGGEANVTNVFILENKSMAIAYKCSCGNEFVDETDVSIKYVDTTLEYIKAV